MLRTPRQAAVREQLAGAGAGLLLLAALRRRPEDAAEEAALQPAMHADEHVLECSHRVEEPDVLEGAADAERGDLVLREADDVTAVEDDLPGGRRVGAGQHVEEGRLPRPVRAD